MLCLCCTVCKISSTKWRCFIPILFFQYWKTRHWDCMPCLVCLALCRFHLCGTKRIPKGLHVWSVRLYVGFTCVAPKGYRRNYMSCLSGFMLVLLVWHQKDTEGMTCLVCLALCQFLLCGTKRILKGLHVFSVWLYVSFTCVAPKGYWRDYMSGLLTPLSLPYIGFTCVVPTGSRRDCMSLLWSYEAKLQLASWPLHSWGMHLLSRLYCPLFSSTGQLGLDKIFNIWAGVWRCDVYGQQFGMVKPTRKICPWLAIIKYSKELHNFQINLKVHQLCQHSQTMHVQHAISA